MIGQGGWNGRRQVVSEEGSRVVVGNEDEENISAWTIVMLLLWDRSCRSNLLSHSVTVRWPWPGQPVPAQTPYSQVPGRVATRRMMIFFFFLFLHSQLYFWRSPFFFLFFYFGEIFVYVTILFPNHRGSHIPSSIMVHDGCVFVASIHLSKTWMSGSFWVCAIECICAQTRPWFILTSQRVFGKRIQNPC